MTRISAAHAAVQSASRTATRAAEHARSAARTARTAPGDLGRRTGLLDGRAGMAIGASVAMITASNSLYNEHKAVTRLLNASVAGAMLTAAWKTPGAGLWRAIATGTMLGNTLPIGIEPVMQSVASARMGGEGVVEVNVGPGKPSLSEPPTGKLDVTVTAPGRDKGDPDGTVEVGVDMSGLRDPDRKVTVEIGSPGSGADKPKVTVEVDVPDEDDVQVESGS